MEKRINFRLGKGFSSFSILIVCVLINSISSVIFYSIAYNGSGLCDGGAIEAQIFNFAQMLNRRTTVEICSFAPLLQNPC